jgi:hypothetical protein
VLWVDKFRVVDPVFNPIQAKKLKQKYLQIEITSQSYIYWQNTFSIVLYLSYLPVMTLAFDPDLQKI